MQSIALSDVSDFVTSNKTLVCVASLAVVGVVYAIQKIRDYLTLPPGPVGLPIIGSFLSMDVDHLHLDFYKIAQKHGPICSFYMGQNLIILVSDYEMMKEMLNMNVFTGRTQNGFLKSITQGCGIILSEGQCWLNQRRFSLQVLRDFGFAKTLSADLVTEEVQNLERVLSEMCSVKEGVNVLNAITNSSNRIIAALTFAQSLDAVDPEFDHIMDTMKVPTATSFLSTPGFLFPTLGNQTWLLKRIPAIKDLFAITDKLHAYGLKRINQRKAVMTEESESQCLCDSYILEQRKAEAAGDFETFKNHQLIRVCMELFNAGTETTSKSLEWLMIYMALYPKVQDKVYNEISAALGEAGRVQMKDKAELNYVQAVVEETFRKVSLVSLGVFHRAMETTYFHGYKIPSHATIMPFIYGIHHDTKYWDKPEEYKPERFLDPKGLFHADPHVVTFLVGKRSCLGESLAKMEVFMFFVSIMQRFQIKLHPDYNNKTADILKGTLGMVFSAGDYRLLLSKRN